MENKRAGGGECRLWYSRPSTYTWRDDDGRVHVIRQAEDQYLWSWKQHIENMICPGDSWVPLRFSLEKNNAIEPKMCSFNRKETKCAAEKRKEENTHTSENA